MCVYKSLFMVELAIQHARLLPEISVSSINVNCLTEVRFKFDVKLTTRNRKLPCLTLTDT